MSNTKHRTVKQAAETVGYTRQGVDKLLRHLNIVPSVYPGTNTRYLTQAQFLRLRRLASERKAARCSD